MKKNFEVLLLILSFSLVFTGLAHASSGALGSSELINHAKEHDGKSITFSGEVIGDVMKRGEFAWVNINDGDNAVGIWMSADLTKEINFTGTYKSQGDTLEITGVFHRACLEHGGDLDIHAQTLRKLASGKITEHKFDFFKVKAILILFGALFLIWILSLFKRR